VKLEEFTAECRRLQRIGTRGATGSALALACLLNGPAHALLEGYALKHDPRFWDFNRFWWAPFAIAAIVALAVRIRTHSAVEPRKNITQANLTFYGPENLLPRIDMKTTLTDWDCY
jgi:hypothetical protein